MSRGARALTLLCCVFCIGAADGQQRSRSRTAWSLAVSDAHVSADVDRVPLRLVLEQLAREVPLRFTTSEAVRDHPVNAHFRDLPLNEALARLLAGLAYAAVIYDTTVSIDGSAGATRAVELLVMDRASGSKSVQSSVSSPVTISSLPPSGAVDVPPDLQAALQNPDREIRLEALQRVAQQGAATAMNALTQALIDPDEQVRARAQQLVDQVFAAQAATAERH